MRWDAVTGLPWWWREPPSWRERLWLVGRLAVGLFAGALVVVVVLAGLAAIGALGY